VVRLWLVIAYCYVLLFPSLLVFSLAGLRPPICFLFITVNPCLSPATCFRVLLRIIVSEALGLLFSGTSPSRLFFIHYSKPMSFGFDGLSRIPTKIRACASWAIVCGAMLRHLFCLRIL
jgi:hypothetical protein